MHYQCHLGQTTGIPKQKHRQTFLLCLASHSLEESLGILGLVTMPTKGSFLSANPSRCTIAAAHRVCTLIFVFTRGRSAIPRAGHTQILRLGENNSLALEQVEELRDRVIFRENPPGLVRRDGGRGCVSKDLSGLWALVVK